MPYTCTSINPYKAALFSIYCRNKFTDAVCYIAKTESLKFGVHPENSHGAKEEEIGWIVAPLNFYPHTMGYVTADEIRAILRARGLVIPAVVTQPYIDEICDITPAMDVKFIHTIVVVALQFIKKP